MRKGVRHFLAIAALVVSGAATAGGTAFAQDTQAAANARYDALAAEENARRGDPAFDFELGIAALDAGLYGDAIIALQRVLAVQPGNASARAELARAYALAGDVETARQEFATVVDDPSLPDPVRQRFTGFVRQFDRQIAGGGSDVSGFLEARAGHDSNINTATELDTIVIPLFSFLGPGTLGPGAVSQDDQFYELQGGVSAVTAISRQDRLFASALGNWRDNFDSGAFDQAALTGTAGYAHSFANRDVISFSMQVQQFWLGHDPYRTSYGVVGQYTRQLGAGRALTASAQWNRLDFEGDPLRDADRYAIGFGYVTQNIAANVSGGLEETRRVAGDSQSNWFVTTSVGGEFPVGPRLALVAGAGLDLRRYDAADPLFLVAREDERLDLTGGVKFALTDTLFLQPRATYSRNWSNITLYDYERWTASIGLRFEF